MRLARVVENILTDWNAGLIPDLSGKQAIVTGASSGLGLETAKALAAKGASVVLAVRDLGRGEAAASKIRAAQPDAKLTVSPLDLASLASVRDFSERMADTLARLDILINNAGLGLQSKRGVTADGFECQFGTNHLGHFALTGQLIPVLLRAPAPRVVSIASIAHRRGAIDFNDLQTERPYSGRRAYGQSKLANLMFALELDRRARQQSSRLLSVAAHPGVATSGFVAATGKPGPIVALGQLAISILGNTTLAGALPGLYAATMPDLIGGQYWGPDGIMEVRGVPALAKLAPQAKDKAVWSRLWTVSEALTGVVYPPLT
jgi:NAD(P)-dependent dehydrogenase (short-subunit alcohol dehydrogenase family)